MPEPDVVQPSVRTASAWPDLPLVVEQLQDQIEGLRELAEAQQRQLDEQRARLEALEGR